VFFSWFACGEVVFLCLRQNGFFACGEFKCHTEITEITESCALRLQTGSLRSQLG